MIKALDYAEPSQELRDAVGDMGLTMNPFAAQQQLLVSGKLDLPQVMRILENLSKYTLDVMKQNKALAERKEETHEDWIEGIVAQEESESNDDGRQQAGDSAPSSE